jgi:hypothetical protein
MERGEIDESSFFRIRPLLGRAVQTARVALVWIRKRGGFRNRTSTASSISLAIRIAEAFQHFFLAAVHRWVGPRAEVAEQIQPIHRRIETLEAT